MSLVSDKLSRICGIFLAVAFLISSLNVRAECDTDCVTVVSEGLGVDIDSALRRATENALMQLVGTFVDTERTVSKRTEIRGAVKEQTKSVDQRFSKYTKGSIRELKILESREEDGLIYVTAQVLVKLDEFKAVIRSSGISDVQPVPKSLFAQAQNLKAQADNLAEIIFEGQSLKILSLDFVEVEVLDIGLLESSAEIARAERILKPAAGESLVKVRVIASLSQRFMESFSETIEEISLKSYSGTRISSIPELVPKNDGFWILTANFNDKYGSGRDIKPPSWRSHLGMDHPAAHFIGSFEKQANYSLNFPHRGVDDFSQAQIFTFPETLSGELCELGKARLPSADDRFGGAAVHLLTPSVNFQITGEGGGFVIDELLSDSNGYDYSNGFVQGDRSIVVSKNFFERGGSDLFSEHSLRFLEFGYGGGSRGEKRCILAVDPKKEFLILTKMTLDELSASRGVQLSLQNSFSD